MGWDMLRFLIDNRRWLGTGLLLTFASSFGQTWFISLFAGQIRAAYGLSDGGWGAIYTLATLAAAGLLLARGSLADTMALSRLAPAVAVLMEDASKGANARMTVDLQAQTVTASDGQVFSFEVDAFKKHCLLNGLDDIALTLEKAAAIDTYEAAATQARPWV